MAVKVLIIGAGAIGAFYGSMLAKAGADVSVVCRSDYAHVKQKGYIIDSKTLGSRHFMPTQILNKTADYEGAPDYVLLCTKVIPSLDRVSLLQPVVTSRSALVFIQNGVEIENELQIAFPDHQMISGLAYICCNRDKPGEIKHLAYGRLSLGDLSGTAGESGTKLCALFNMAGIECSISDDIITERWKKCIWNAPFNPLSVLSGLTTLAIVKSEERLVRCIMQEICAIASACEHPLPAGIIDLNIEYTYAMPPYKTSMLLDYEQGRPMETEAIVGNALRAAHRTGTPCPHLETVYALLKLKEL